jgi:hypothetical protein
MAFVLNYNSLVTQLTNYLERDDPNLVASIPTFILLGQERIDKECKTLGLEVYINGNFQINNSVIVKPNRWRNTITFSVGNGLNNNVYNPILLRSYEFCRLYWPDDSQTAMPLYYADYAFNNWLVVPTPDQAYPIEISYMETTAPIDETNQTNWITDNAPDLLLYACLLETAPFLKDDERIQTWKLYYDASLAALNQEDKGRLTDRFSDRAKD